MVYYLINRYEGLGDHLNLSTATDVGILCTIVTKDLIL